MMGQTSIEWADHTVNPIRARNLETGAVGHFCEKVSPECANCYASDWNERVRPSGKHLIGTGLAFLPVNRAKVETFLDRSKLEEVLRRRKPTRYFWCDMTDLFGEWVPDAMIDACFAVMALTPHHTHMVLTKRADRQLAYMLKRSKSAQLWKDAARTLGYALEFEGISLVPFPLPSVQLGVSVGNQTWADKRIWDLLRTPAAVRFISAEPLLGPLDLERVGHDEDCGGALNALTGEYWIENWHDNVGAKRSRDVIGTTAKLDLVIDGGESGPRLSHPDWFRSLRDQCQAAGVAYFHKQHGDWVPFYDRDKDDPDWRNVPHESKKVKRLNVAGGEGFHGDRVVYFRRRKATDGRELDGREWNDLPAARA